MSILIIGLLSWLGLLVLAIFNAGLRDMIYGPQLSEPVAHQISCVILAMLIYAATMYFLYVNPIDASLRDYITIGVLWTGLTVAFEFLFFHYVRKYSWKELLGNYDVRKGRLWPLVLIATLTAPVLIGMML